MTYKYILYFLYVMNTYQIANHLDGFLHSGYMGMPSPPYSFNVWGFAGSKSVSLNTPELGGNSTKCGSRSDFLDCRLSML